MFDSKIKKIALVLFTMSILTIGYLTGGIETLLTSISALLVGTVVGYLL